MKIFISSMFFIFAGFIVGVFLVSHKDQTLVTYREKKQDCEKSLARDVNCKMVMTFVPETKSEH